MSDEDGSTSSSSLSACSRPQGRSTRGGIAIRAVGPYPSLMITLERAGVTSAAILAAAATRAEALSDISDDQMRTAAILTFQATLGVLDRVIRSGGLSKADAETLVSRLVQIDHASRGYSARIATWIQKDLLPRLPEVNSESFDALEDTLLAAMAGANPQPLPTVSSNGKAVAITSMPDALKSCGCTGSGNGKAGHPCTRRCRRRSSRRRTATATKSSTTR